MYSLPLAVACDFLCYNHHNHSRVDDLIARKGPLATATLILMVGFVASRLLGLVRSIVIATLFGTAADYNVYLAAFRIPDFLFQILAGAVLGSAFLPTFTGYMAKGQRREGWLLASSILNAVALGTFVLSVLAWLFAPFFWPRVFPGFSDAEQTALGVQLTRIMLLSPIFFGISGIVTGILNGQKHFLAPAVAPLIYNLSIIGGAWLFGGPWGTKGLAVGVAAGALAHLLVQLPALRSGGMEYSPRIVFGHPGVREVGRLMVPRAVGLAAVQINFLVITILASSLPEGKLAALDYAWQAMMMPLGIFGMAISTAVFPTLAEEASLDQLDKMKATLLQSLRLILFLTVPASLGLIILREPLIATVFERGAFVSSSTEATAYALMFYTIGLTGHGALEIINRGFFALRDTRTPVAVGVGAMVVNAAMCMLLIRILGHGGLALSMSIAAIIESSVLLLLLDRRLQGLIDRQTVLAVGKMIAGGAVMSVVLVGFLRLPLALGGNGLQRAIDTGLAIAVGGATYLLAMWMMGSEEVTTLSRRVLRR